MTVHPNEEQDNEEQGSEEKNRAMDPLDDKLNRALELEMKSGAKKRNQRSGGNNSMLLMLAIIIGLIGLGISSYVFYRQILVQDWQSVVNQKLSSSENRLDDLLPKMAEMNTGIKDLDERMAELAKTGALIQAQVDDKLKSTLKAIDKKLGATSEDWILAEVEYLVRLASQRLILDRDIIGARNLLQAADNILNKSEVLTAFEVRQAIANDLMKLENLELVDREGIYARITAVYNLIDQLQQKRLAYVETESPTEETIQSESSWSDQAAGLFHRMLQNVVKLVDFRRHDVPVKPMLPPEEEYYLKQNLKLKLELARIALLNGNQAIYNQSITEARDWVVEHFEHEDGITITSLKSLEEVQGIAVETELADVSESLTAIHQYMTKFDKVSSKLKAEAVQ